MNATGASSHSLGSPASGAGWAPWGLPGAMDPSTVIVTTLISTCAMSLQGTVRSLLLAVGAAVYMVATTLLQKVFLTVRVPLSPSLVGTIETLISPMHTRLHMVGALALTPHIPRPGWFLLIRGATADQPWLRALSGGAVLTSVARWMIARITPMAAVRCDGDGRAAGKGKPFPDGAAAPAPAPLWAIMHVSEQAFEAMHRYALLENQISRNQSQSTVREDTVEYTRSPRQRPEETLGGHQACVTLYAVKGCALTLQALVSKQTNSLVEVPDTSPGYDHMVTYAVDQVGRQGTQLLGSVLTSREAKGMVYMLLPDREYKVRALDGVTLAVTIGTAGLRQENFTGSRSLFVRLVTQVEGDPTAAVLARVEAIRVAGLGRPKLHILTYRANGRHSGKPDGSAGVWHATESADQRSLDTVCMDADRRAGLVADITAFRDGGARYRELGVPWKRSYLLFGPPGTGKTSLLRAIATHFRLHICFVQVTTHHTDQDLMNMFSTVPPNCMVVFEDVDRINFADGGGPPAPAARDDDDSEEEGPAPQTQAKRKAPRHAFTLQGLLNALDGVVDTACRLCFLTANHPERLAKALRRRGRIDVDMHLDLLRTSDMVGAMIRRFFPSAAPVHVDALAGRALEAAKGAVAPCELQAMCMRFAVRGVEAALQEPIEDLLAGML